jgi:hypothetical protein
MMKDAESHRRKTSKRARRVETRNRAIRPSTPRRSFLKDSGDKLDPADRLAIESATTT